MFRLRTNIRVSLPKVYSTSSRQNLVNKYSSRPILVNKFSLLLESISKIFDDKVEKPKLIIENGIHHIFLVTGCIACVLIININDDTFNICTIPITFITLLIILGFR